MEQFPEPRQTLMATGSQTAIGGKGANQVIAAALTGTDTQMIDAVGRDGGGTAFISVPPGFRPARPISRSAGRGNTIVVDPCADHTVSAQQAARSTGDAGWVLLSL